MTSTRSSRADADQRWARHTPALQSPRQHAGAAHLRLRWTHPPRSDEAHLWIEIEEHPDPPHLGWHTEGFGAPHGPWLLKTPDAICHVRCTLHPDRAIVCHWQGGHPWMASVHFHLDGQGHWEDRFESPMGAAWHRDWTLNPTTELYWARTFAPTTGLVQVADRWQVNAEAHVAWCERMHGLNDVRATTDVRLMHRAQWRMATTGWLAPGAWHDHRIMVRHVEASSSSALDHRAVLFDGAQRWLSSDVHLSIQAAHARTTQRLAHWMMGRSGGVDAHPFLRIDTPSVDQATHGSSVGRLDPTALIFLRGRGLSRAAAGRLLLDGALAQGLPPKLVADDTFHDAERGWWGRQRTALRDALQHPSLDWERWWTDEAFQP